MPREFFVKTTPGFWYSAAIMIMFLPLPWIVAFFISSFVHELCHILTARLFGVHIRALSLCAFGAYLETDHMTSRQQMICSLAGPVGALLLLFLSPWMPRTSLCAFLQSCYHMLPVFPQDAGRALQSWTRYAGIRHSEAVCFAAELTTITIISLVGLYLSVFLRWGLLPLSVCIVMICRICREKYLANKVGKGYNISSNL